MLNFSQPRTWLTLGSCLIALFLSSAFAIAHQSIANRLLPLEEMYDESLGLAYYLNDLLFIVSEAEIIQNISLETGDREQLELIFSYLQELSEEAKTATEDWEDEELFSELNVALDSFIETLAESRDRAVTDNLSPRDRLEISRELVEARLELQIVVQGLLEEISWEQQWEITDARIDLDRSLWLIGIFLGLSLVILGILSVWLRSLLGQNEHSATELQHHNQSLSQELHVAIADLQNTKTLLAAESHRCREIEAAREDMERAKELTDLKLNFFSLASHEFRTPLSTILVSAQLLDNAKAEWSAEKRSRNLRRIQAAAKSMTQLLADILILTRAEAGKLEFTPETITLPEFCQNLVEEVKYNTQAQHEISLSYDGDYQEAYLDEKLLRAILMSLLVNAIKYSPPESEIKLIVIGEENKTRFQVCDRGIGIPPVDRKHLFETFHRGQNAQASVGTGLGLALVKKCLDLHGGAIAVDSQLGTGTTFTIEIPWLSRSEE
ncbi:sensor histidine kinase [Roseofilum casamattae]|uniref:histidine kinase n=1 Tax=Roseofilum casamattae BLCC-M143 TaxID=3022442 RepID=A0ABT7BVD3_9CYAN|nr:HAMP domain-containing sensor histidine kinase [Roseofilum casamattae]MDJ1183152.1 HAMP domain-containing sensor histidine kinase [Roseofilum casamattae BLCC-M143]